MKILFLYDQRHPYKWKDGVWRAIKELEKNNTVVWNNLIFEPPSKDYFDVAIGRGDWNGIVEKSLRFINSNKKALYICGNVQTPETADFYDTLFYENEIQLNQIKHHHNKHFAFGVNTELNIPLKTEILWDYTTIGAFATWKRQEYLINKTGNRLAVGEIQHNNLNESMHIIGRLLLDGIMISDQVDAETLVKIYNSSKIIYIPASIEGGGERAVLEARACGREVEIENDNYKLKKLLDGPIYDHLFIYSQFLKCL